jgi:TfoX/Sxy family transcriptional regulator of competence genes
MAYDENLADRVREALEHRPGFSEKKMFGWRCFLLNGNMCCGVTADALMLRLGNEGAAEALLEPNTREMDFTGRVMKSMVYIEPAGWEPEEELEDWVDQGCQFCVGIAHEMIFRSTRRTC